MKKVAIAFIGMGLLSLPFATYSQAETKPNSPSAASETGSPKPRGATQAGETDITNTKGQAGGVPSKYTIMPVARGKKVEVNSEMIGDTVKNPKGEELGKLEQLIMDSETKRIEYAMISIGDTGQLRAFPWSSFKVNKEQGTVILNMTKEQLHTTTTDLSPPIQAIQEQLEALRKSEARRGVGAEQSVETRGTVEDRSETKSGSGPAVGDK
jgi:sporulation protein YlmC with PRC-barrel domain